MKPSKRSATEIQAFVDDYVRLCLRHGMHLNGSALYIEDLPIWFGGLRVGRRRGGDLLEIFTAGTEKGTRAGRVESRALSAHERLSILRASE